ncbi:MULTISPECIES: hypothetical protein [unclassified Chryseobacterium]|uniref:hypothetical protein n=1 Tax=unclassified Chryseobacterium TaxID=2593645 RepID=UPI00226AF06B|nr:MULTISPECIES: hypothetical protein [unclassified Chryseobacterium]
MSAIKNLSLKNLFPTFLLLIFFSCEQKKEISLKAETSNEITFMGFSKVGGKGGNYKTVKITKDSIKLEQGSTATQKHQKWASNINNEDWKNLTSSFDTATLDKIKSSESIQAQDGMDETFQIKTSKKSHVYVNSYNDSIHYKQFEKFKSQLDKILPKEYK